MKILKQVCLFIPLCTLGFLANAEDECLNFKTNPSISVSIPEWEKSVVRPLRPMDLLHGNVIATLSEKYSIAVELESIEDGFCVVLKQVDAEIGYNDFLVQIDSRHITDSCEFNKTLEHEDAHIRAHLSVIDDNMDNIKTSVASAANSIMPVFVQLRVAAEKAIDAINEEMQKHPAIILVKQKIKAEEEIQNKKIDQNPNIFKIEECFE